MAFGGKGEYALRLVRDLICSITIATKDGREVLQETRRTRHSAHSVAC